MVCLGVLMLFRAVSWSMGYILIAKNDENVYATAVVQ
jgi:hypothetical protein